MGNLDDPTREAIIDFLLAGSVNGRLKRGDLAAAAGQFGCHVDTVGRLWKRYKEAKERGVVGRDIGSRIKGRSGRKKKDRAALRDAIVALPVDQRSQLRSVAAAANIGLATAHSLLQEGVLRRHTSTIKPTLSETNRFERVRFALSFVDDESVGAGGSGPEVLPFSPMLDVVHIDEKWFNQDTARRSFYLVNGEEEPAHTRHNTKFIEKTMFLVAVARPR